MIKYLCLLLLPFFAFAQSPKPTEAQLDKALVQLKTLSRTDPNSALKALESLKSKIDTAQWPDLYARCTANMGAIYDNQDNYKRALDYYNMAFNSFKRAGDSKNLIRIYQSIGGAWYSMNEPEKALDFYNKALTLGKTADSKSLPKTYSNMGNIYYEKGEYVPALKYYITGMTDARASRDTDLMASLSSNIGVIYWEQRDYKNALSYAEDALKYHALLNDYKGMATAYNNMAGIHEEQNHFTEAMGYYKKAIEYAEKVGYLTAIGTAYNNMAEDAYVGNDFKHALEYAEKGLAIRRKIGKNTGIIRSLAKVGEASAALHDNVKALASFTEAMKLADADSNLHEQKRLSKKFATFYKGEGKFEQALNYQEKFQAYSDSLFNQDNNRTLKEMQTRFETEKKQQQITLLNQQNTIQSLTITRRNTAIGLIGVLLVGVIIAGSLLYNRAKLKQEALLQAEVLRQQEMAAKGVIEAEERERKRIAADLHDGVGQLFSAVRLNLGSLIDRLKPTLPDDEALAHKTLALVDESCGEVRTMAHQMMPNILLKTGLASAIKEFVTQIDDKKLKVNVETSGLNERLDNDTEIVLYRVIQECVNNVIKHAGANRLDIQLHREEHEISATIEDNGKGFDTSDKDKFEGIGLKNMITRLAYLKGTVDFSSSPGRGTLVAIYVPLKS